MIKQPDINTVFRPTFLGNRVLAKPPAPKNPNERNLHKHTSQATVSNANSDAIIINVHLSGRKLLQQFGWIFAACLWGLVFAFLLMR